MKDTTIDPAALANVKPSDMQIETLAGDDDTGEAA